LIDKFDFAVLRNKNFVFVHEKVVVFPKLRDLLPLLASEKYHLRATEGAELIDDKKTFNKLVEKQARRVLELSYYGFRKNCGLCFRIASAENLFTYDGQHLTKAGVMYFAQFFDAELSSFLGQTVID